MNKTIIRREGDFVTFLPDTLKVSLVSTGVSLLFVFKIKGDVDLSRTRKLLDEGLHLKGDTGDLNTRSKKSSNVRPTSTFFFFFLRTLPFYKIYLRYRVVRQRQKRINEYWLKKKGNGVFYTLYCHTVDISIVPVSTDYQSPTKVI